MYVCVLYGGWAVRPGPVISNNLFTSPTPPTTLTPSPSVQPGMNLNSLSVSTLALPNRLPAASPPSFPYLDLFMAYRLAYTTQGEAKALFNKTAFLSFHYQSSLPIFPASLSGTLYGDTQPCPCCFDVNVRGTTTKMHF